MRKLLGEICFLFMDVGMCFAFVALWMWMKLIEY